MIIVPTEKKHTHTETPYTRVEDHVRLNEHATSIFGLKKTYSVAGDDRLMDVDGWWYPSYAGSGYGNREFSDDDQAVLLKHMKDVMTKKDKIVIVEIGVHRNAYDISSTGTILSNKRPDDIYIGIDLEDKSFLNDTQRNIHTIQTSSHNHDVVYELMDKLDASEIDLLMIDGWHSINAVYKDWQYTSRLSKDGVVVMHDTNAHPGPYLLMLSIDEQIFDVYKYLSDVKDYGVGVAVRKP